MTSLSRIIRVFLFPPLFFIGAVALLSSCQDKPPQSKVSPASQTGESGVASFTFFDYQGKTLSEKKKRTFIKKDGSVDFNTFPLNPPTGTEQGIKRSFVVDGNASLHEKVRFIQLSFQFQDIYDSGYSNRLWFIIQLDGKEVLRHDIATNVTTKSSFISFEKSDDGWFHGKLFFMVNAEKRKELRLITRYTGDEKETWGWGSYARLVLRNLIIREDTGVIQHLGTLTERLHVLEASLEDEKKKVKTLADNLKTITLQQRETEVQNRTLRSFYGKRLRVLEKKSGVAFFPYSTPTPFKEGPSGEFGCIADFNKDGKQDIFLNRLQKPGEAGLLLLQGSNGIFHDTTEEGGVRYASQKEGEPVYGAHCADVNNDGNVDIVTVFRNMGENSKLFINKGDGRFSDKAEEMGLTPSEQGAAYGEAVGLLDYNGDTKLDLLLSFYGNNSLLYRNDGESFSIKSDFTDSSFSQIEGLVTVDVNHDGKTDFVAQGRICMNQGGEKGFHCISVDPSSRNKEFKDNVTLGIDEGVLVADLDNDGEFEIYLQKTNYKQGYENIPNGYQTYTDGRLYKRQKDGSYRDITEEAGLFFVNPDDNTHRQFYWGAAALDWDNDGDLDLLVSGFNGKERPSRFFENEGDGTFVDITDIVYSFMDVSPYFSSVQGSAGYADFDNDGDLDLLLQGSIYYNATNNDRYLFTRVTNKEGQKNMFGATVSLKGSKTGKVIATRFVENEHGYMMQSQYENHFGLDPSLAYDLEVVFPSAERKVVVNKTVNRVLGQLIPKNLKDRTVEIRRDGTVIIDSRSFPPQTPVRY